MERTTDEEIMTKKRILMSGAASGFGELAAIGLARAGHDVIVGAQIWPQVTQLRLKAEALGLKGDVGLMARAERIVLLAVILPFAGLGALPYGIYLLAALTSITVVQRMLFVRSQLQTTSEG